MNIPGDHTYATSVHGHIWPCCGRAAKGSLIASGAGNTTYADCISQPASGATAPGSYGSFDYGLSGLCHQITNRVLHPTGQTVSAASGYRGSFFAWGAYGADYLNWMRRYSPGNYPWPEFDVCTKYHFHV